MHLIYDSIESSPLNPTLQLQLTHPYYTVCTRTDTVVGSHNCITTSFTSATPKQVALCPTESVGAGEGGFFSLRSSSPPGLLDVTMKTPAMDNLNSSEGFESEDDYIRRMEAQSGMECLVCTLSEHG